MEFDEIVVKESPGLCRCCLSEGCYKDLGTEYTWMNETEVYADMLLECFDISITQHNEGPNGPNRLICEVCITRLRDACNFKKQVMDSEKKFIDMMGRGEFRPKMLIYQTQVKCEEAIDVEPVEDADVEYLEDDVEFADGNDALNDEAQPSVSDITVSTLPVKGKRGRPRKNAAPKQDKRKVAKVDNKAKTSKAAAPKERRTTEETYLLQLNKKRRNVLQILKYGNVVPFNWQTKGFRCFYCYRPMRDCDVLKEHTQHHDEDLERFVIRRIISKDIPIKIDVSDLSCKVCMGEPFADLENLISHIILAHEEEYDSSLGVCALPFILNKDTMKCVLCEKQYDNFTCMVNHMHKDHVSHSFICQICGLSFINKSRLKRHINNCHVGFRCSVCKKVFNAFHRLQQHKQKMHGEDTRQECTLCSRVFQSAYQLKVHLGKVHNVEKYKIRCEYCPKVCSTKGAMVLHVKARHLDAQFHCDMCNYKTGIKWLITLHKKKHFDDRDYGCSICEKTFRRSSNLRAHIKVHTGVSGRVCRICRKGFANLESLNDHKTAFHYFEES